MAAVKWYNQVK